MGFNRNKLKAALKPASIQDVAANSSMSTQTPGMKILERKDGKALYRFMPTQEGGKFWAVPKVVSWLPLEVEKDGETKMSRRPIFNSRQHAGIKYDIVEEYVNFILDNKDAFDNFEDINTAIIESPYPIKTGITPKATKVAYTLELDPDLKDEEGLPVIIDFGRYEIKTSVWNEVNNFMTNTDNHDEALTHDPFTEIDEGYYIIVNFRKNKYEVTVKRKAFPVPDEYLEQFQALKPLEEVMKYKESDWDKQIEGLRNVDEQFNVGLFDSTEFKAIINKVRAELDDKLGSSTESTETQTTASSEADESEEEAIALVTAEIRAFASEHPELKSDVRMKKTMTAAERRDLLVAAQRKLAEAATADADDDGLFEE